MSEGKKLEMKDCSCTPTVHEMDKNIFKKTKEDAKIQDHLKKKSKSKQRGRSKDELTKRTDT